MPILGSPGPLVAPDAGPSSDRRPDDGRLCRRGGLCEWVTSENIDKLDLLFVVDDGPSMAEEQQALREQLPYLVQALFSGDRDGDGGATSRSVKDAHFGVVSTNMGIAGTGDDNASALGAMDC